MNTRIGILVMILILGVLMAACDEKDRSATPTSILDSIYVGMPEDKMLEILGSPDHSILSPSGKSRRGTTIYTWLPEGPLALSGPETDFSISCEYGKVVRVWSKDRRGE